MNSHVFIASLKQERLPLPVQEHRFHSTRRWRFDYAWPEHMIALEVEGGVFSGGRHTRGSGFVGDMAKYNAAASMGWRVIRCQPKELCNTDTMRLIRTTLFTPKAV